MHDLIGISKYYYVLFLFNRLSTSCRWFHTSSCPESYKYKVIMLFCLSSKEENIYAAKCSWFLWKLFTLLPNGASMTFSTGQEGSSWRRWKSRPKRTEGAAYSFNHQQLLLFFIKQHNTNKIPCLVKLNSLFPSGWEWAQWTSRSRRSRGELRVFRLTRNKCCSAACVAVFWLLPVSSWLNKTVLYTQGKSGYKGEKVMYGFCCTVSQYAPMAWNIGFPRLWKICISERGWRIMFSRPDKVPWNWAYTEKTLGISLHFVLLVSSLFNIKPVYKYLQFLFYWRNLMISYLWVLQTSSWLGY